MVEPIKPSEITQIIPEWVIKGANECIQAHYQELIRESHFTQDELISYVSKYAPDYGENANIRNMLFKNHWLDIEPTYRRVGWIVNYDKPAYNESYPTNFTFKLPK